MGRIDADDPRRSEIVRLSGRAAAGGARSWRGWWLDVLREVAAVTTVRFAWKDALWELRRALAVALLRSAPCRGRLSPRVSAKVATAPGGAAGGARASAPRGLLPYAREVDRIASDIVTLSSIGRGRRYLSFVVGVGTRWADEAR